MCLYASSRSEVVNTNIPIELSTVLESFSLPGMHIRKLSLQNEFTCERVGTVVGSNSSHRFGSMGTQTRPRTKNNTM